MLYRAQVRWSDASPEPTWTFEVWSSEDDRTGSVVTMANKVPPWVREAIRECHETFPTLFP